MGRVSLAQGHRGSPGETAVRQARGRGQRPPRVGHTDSGYDNFLPLQQAGAIVDDLTIEVKNYVLY